MLSISLELPEFEVIKQLSFSMKLEGYRFSKNGILVKVISNCNLLFTFMRQDCLLVILLLFPYLL